MVCACVRACLCAMAMHWLNFIFVREEIWLCSNWLWQRHRWQYECTRKRWADCFDIANVNAFSWRLLLQIKQHFKSLTVSIQCFVKKTNFTIAFYLISKYANVNLFEDSFFLSFSLSILRTRNWNYLSWCSLHSSSAVL